MGSSDQLTGNRHRHNVGNVAATMAVLGSHPQVIGLSPHHIRHLVLEAHCAGLHSITTVSCTSHHPDTQP